jgi:DNA-binding transcriptional ArsR family regulator
MSNSKEEPFMEILRSEIRFRIFVLLNLYPELSYSQISQKLRKSKSTLHPHLEKLIELELIEVSREEKIRGNIPAKFYSLKKGYLDTLANIDEENSELPVDESTLVLFKTMTNFMIKTMEMYYKFFEKMAYEGEISKLLEEMRKNKEGFSSMYFFSKEQFMKAHEYYQEFNEKLNELEVEESGLKKERPFFLITVAIPLKRIIETINIPKKSIRK